MITLDTPQDALKQFFRSVSYITNKTSRQITRRYIVAGRACMLSKGMSRKCRPRFQWIEHAPEKYEGIDITAYFRDRYLVPYARPNPPKEVLEADESPMTMTHGVAIHELDTGHYSKLRAKLEARAEDLFPGDERGEDYV